MLQIIDPEYLKSIYNGNIHTPTVYFHPISVIRRYFWKRLELAMRLIERFGSKRELCLDIGGGSGVFLPTLSTLFQKVKMVDLDPSQARLVCEKFHLSNCEIRQEDIFTLKPGGYDAIVAMDVLEHFQELDPIVRHVKSLMEEKTLLVVSLPTENLLYDLLRILFRQKKPDDHYHSAADVEKALYRHGLVALRSYSYPFSGVGALARISAWRVGEAKES